MNWWPASELLTRFQVWGRFYEARVAGVSERLRSHLELFPLHWSPTKAIECPADLVVVMMNPGSSQPLPSMDSHLGFVPTRPDNTQYQILRLMLRAQSRGMLWQHARVINLSDLRTPKSTELIVKLRQYAGDSRHSIFSKERHLELSAALGDPDTPVLRAWGLNPALAPLAKLAWVRLNAHPELGIAERDFAYRHPLPQRADLQRAWLDQVSQQAENAPPRPRPLKAPLSVGVPRPQPARERRQRHDVTERKGNLK